MRELLQKTLINFLSIMTFIVALILFIGLIAGLIILGLFAYNVSLTLGIIYVTVVAIILIFIVSLMGALLEDD